MENSVVPNLKIYGEYLSQPTRSILAFCKINKIPYEFKFINLAKGENLMEDYLNINPYGKLPAIVLNEGNGKKDFQLAESCSILRFLAEYFKVDDFWYPKDDLFRKAMINQWMDWHHTNTRYALANFVFKNVFAKTFEAKGIKIEKPDTFKLTGKILGFLNKILEKRKFIVDDIISIADLIIACEIYQLILTNYDLSQFPFVIEYLKRVNSYEGMNEINQIFENIASKVKIKLNKPKF